MTLSDLAKYSIIRQWQWRFQRHVRGFCPYEITSKYIFNFFHYRVAKPF